MRIILFDTPSRAKLYPLTLTRAIADLRCGILSIKEWWEKSIKQPVLIFTIEYLQEIYPEIPAGDSLFIDACVVPTKELFEQIISLNVGEAVADANGLIASRIELNAKPTFDSSFLQLFPAPTLIDEVKRFSSPCDLFQWNEIEIEKQFKLVTAGRRTQPIPDTVQVVNASRIFIEEGARLDFSILNASNGPIYIGRNTLIMEGSTIRGPFAMCEGAVLKMGSKIYGGTTLGPYCVGGGEIKNSILLAYSNKAHDGYLGDSVIGEWCNIGAGTSNSNIKNTASEVKVWDYYSHSYISSGIKCGLIMGDYSRTAINTSINTGTVVGVCCNVFGEGLTPKVIPDFTWGTKGLTRYEFDKAVKDIINWKRMKNKTFGETKVKVLKHIFEHNNQ